MIQLPRVLSGSLRLGLPVPMPELPSLVYERMLMCEAYKALHRTNLRVAFSTTGWQPLSEFPNYRI